MPKLFTIPAALAADKGLFIGGAFHTFEQVDAPHGPVRVLSVPDDGNYDAPLAHLGFAPYVPTPMPTPEAPADASD
jgi:hypothetical protein